MGDIGNKPSSYDAPNVRANVIAVIADPKMDHKGDAGDLRHLAGSGDHTPYSTHTGKNGYPTQGQVHAHDFGMTQAEQDKFESWVRAEWRAGRLKGLKYMNVNNRHWNIQTTANWNKAVAGTLKATYSGDHHIHLSYENGAVESDLIKRYQAYRDKKTPPATPQAAKDGDVYKVVKVEGSQNPAVYLGNYITRRWVQSGTDLTQAYKLAGQTKPEEVKTKAELDKYGVLVGPDAS